MNAITKALSEVSYGIPLEVLQIGFRENSATINKTISLDEMILSKVIRPRVLFDCNIVGGIQIVVPIEKCEVSYGDNNEMIIKVPKTLTNNKSIVSALSVVGNVTQNFGSAINSSKSSLLNTGVNLSNSLDDSNVLQTSNLEVIGENLVLIEEYHITVVNGYLRCVIENESNLSNISPRSYIKFSKMVLLAVKAYIYNKVVVTMDKGYIYNGHELGVVKDVIDSYSDSNELYLEYLEKVWKEVAFMNDGASYGRFIKSMLGSIV